MVAIKRQIPKPGYCKRMNVYLMEMFPLPARLVSAILLYVGFDTLLARIHGVQQSLFSFSTLLGIGNIFALLLILRLMDELKDEQIDRLLFNDRTLPAGKVYRADISFSLLILFVTCLVINLLTGRAFWMAAVALGYSLLMFKYFFVPRLLQKYLLLNLATHNPIIPILFLYLVVLFAVKHKIAIPEIEWGSTLTLIAMFWGMGLAWEIARKIRSHDEENDYVTYSQVLGRGGAVLAAAIAQTVTFFLALYFYLTLSLSGIFIAIVGFGYAIMIWAYLRFVRNATPATSKLKPFAEWFIVCVLTALVVEGALPG